MGSSLRLFTIRGIEVRMHATFPLILVWAALQFGYFQRGGLAGAISGVVVTLLIFGIVVLHELGHSFVALNYGIPIRQILLLPIGGVAQLTRMPDKPVQEFLVAIAGPLVNVGLAAVMVVPALLLGLRLDSEQLFGILGMLELNAGSVFVFLIGTNLILGLFNLLPAFPMDGGRVLRSLLALRMSYSRATSIAVSIGQFLAFLLGLWGFYSGNFFFVLIAFFIYVGAGQEGQMVRLRSVLAGLTVNQAYSRRPESLAPNSSLRDAVQLTLRSFQANFPVCEGDRLVGLLTQKKLIEALNNVGPETPVWNVMETDFRPVNPRDGLFQTQQLLAESQSEALPVIDEGRFLGLITPQDVSEIYRLASSNPGIFFTRAESSADLR